MRGFILFLFVVVDCKLSCDPFERFDVAKSCDNRNGDRLVTCEWTSTEGELIYANGMQMPLNESIRTNLRHIFSDKFGFEKRNETIWDWSFRQFNRNATTGCYNEWISTLFVSYDVEPGTLINIEALNGICGDYALRTAHARGRQYDKLGNPVVFKRQKTVSDPNNISNS